MRKIFVTLLLFVSILLNGCYSSVFEAFWGDNINVSHDDNTPNISIMEDQTVSSDNVDTNFITEITTEDISEDITEEVKPSSVITIEEILLFDENDVRFTVKDIVFTEQSGFIFEDYSFYEINYLVENYSTQNIKVNPTDFIINRYMTNIYAWSDTIQAGKKYNGSIRIYTSTLEYYSIDTISDILFRVDVVGDSSYDELFRVEDLELKTSAYGTVDQPILDSGINIWEQDGIRIVGKQCDWFDEDIVHVSFFAENRYGEDIIIEHAITAINNYSLYTGSNNSIDQNCMSIFNGLIYKDTLDKNDISEIENFELQFKIFKTNEWENGNYTPFLTTEIFHIKVNPETKELEFLE